ncbi:hypothetical protein FJT64_013484 [Amphibalanus amphitrite]|uniref:Uncharacterized protein n=1 Tax=Amphibalanus amphitrite TaxID=1232801 RepID=A0A6A4V3D7_AMPAM|nr:uncharacterized protein LOC122380274 [Amphibalanus amphitrite]KAF0288115.1 hypothetical protein FJT64_013484 [Amphibalanus amphitrite]
MSMMAANRVRRGRKRADSLITVEAHGEGLLCFAADGSWFQGQLEAVDERDFDLVGRRVADEPIRIPTCASEDVEQAILLESGECGSDDSGRPESPPLTEAERSPELQRAHLLRRGSSASSPGSKCSPTAFESAMRALAAVAPGTPVTYDVNIRDREEGSEHRVRFVPGFSAGSSCHLDSKELQFTAEKRYRGQKADMVIQKRLGRALVGQGCVVFTGQMRVEYQFDYMSTPKWVL